MNDFINMLEIPKWLKLVMIFIDRVGFPVLAFVLMFFLSFTSIGKMTTALEKNNAVMVELITFEKAGHNTLENNQRLIMDNQRTIQNDIKSVMRVR